MSRMWTRRLQAAAFYSRKPAEALFYGGVAHRALNSALTSYELEETQLPAQFVLGVRRFETTQLIAIDLDPDAQKARTLTHHYHPNVDELLAFDVGHVAYCSVFKQIHGSVQFRVFE